MNLAKTIWEGTFTYDNANLYQGAIRSTSFTLNFSTHGLFGISGIIDDHPPGIPEQATFHGHILWKRIKFAKIYPSAWTVDPNGIPERVSAHLERVYGRSPKKASPPSRIFYQGNLDRQRGRMAGTWLVKHDNLLVLSSHGKWSAQIQDHPPGPGRM